MSGQFFVEPPGDRLIRREGLWTWSNFLVALCHAEALHWRPLSGPMQVRSWTHSITSSCIRSLPEDE